MDNNLTPDGLLSPFSFRHLTSEFTSQNKKYNPKLFEIFNDN